MKRTRHLTARQWRESVHDEIGPLLFYLAAEATLLKKRLRGNRRQEAAALIRELENLRGKLRSWVQGKRERQKIDLTAELAGLAEDMGGKFHGNWKGLKLEDRSARLIFQIAREAAHNARRHGGASKVEIFLGRGELRVMDNGGGRPATIQDGIGMKLMKRRASELGGEIRLEKGKRRGAILTCHFPAGPG